MMSYEISTSILFSSGIDCTFTFFKLTLGSKFVITVSISVWIGSVNSVVASSNKEPVILVPYKLSKNTSPTLILTKFCTERLRAASFLRGMISFVMGWRLKDKDISLKIFDIDESGTLVDLIYWYLWPFLRCFPKIIFFIT